MTMQAHDPRTGRIERLIPVLVKRKLIWPRGERHVHADRQHDDQRHRLLPRYPVPQPDKRRPACGGDQPGKHGQQQRQIGQREATPAKDTLQV
jgi:hypothetical protein